MGCRLSSVSEGISSVLLSLHNSHVQDRRLCLTVTVPLGRWNASSSVAHVQVTKLSVDYFLCVTVNIILTLFFYYTSIYKLSGHKLAPYISFEYRLMDCLYLKDRKRNHIFLTENPILIVSIMPLA